MLRLPHNSCLDPDLTYFLTDTGSFHLFLLVSKEAARTALVVDKALHGMVLRVFRPQARFDCLERSCGGAPGLYSSQCFLCIVPLALE